MTAAPVLVLVPDLFFRTKIESTARALGVPTVFLALGQDAAAAAREHGARALVVDLESGDPLASLAEIRRDPATAAVRVVGFFSHVREELAEKAVRAGFDRVLPRSRFSGELPAILRDLAGAGAEA